MATNRFVCEICGKGFQRNQNLLLHRCGHNLPWKLQQRSSMEAKKKVYVCPEKSCVHHDPTLGDLTGIKKHCCRKHGDKKWKCEKCSRGTLFSLIGRHIRRLVGPKNTDVIAVHNSQEKIALQHRAFCDVLAQETSRVAPDPFLIHASLPPAFAPLMRGNDSQWINAMDARLPVSGFHQVSSSINPDGYTSFLNSCLTAKGTTEFGNCSPLYGAGLLLTSSSSSTATTSRTFSTPAGIITASSHGCGSSSRYNQYQQITQRASAHMSATALLQKATEIGAMSLAEAFHHGNFSVNHDAQPLLGGHVAGLQQEHSLHKNTELSSTSTGTSNLWSEMPSHKRDKEEGETRDFLGVGDSGSLFVMPKSNIFIN